MQNPHIESNSLHFMAVESIDGPQKTPPKKAEDDFSPLLAFAAASVFVAMKRQPGLYRMYCEAAANWRDPKGGLASLA